MKTILFLFFLVAACKAQGAVEYLNEWGQAQGSLAGAEGMIRTGQDFDNGTCFVELPQSVELFHVYHMFNVPELSVGNRLAFSGGPTGQWGNNGGNFRFLIFFMNGTDGSAVWFNYTDIIVTCSDTIEPLGVYSFPQHVQQRGGRISTILMDRDGFHKNDVVEVSLPDNAVNISVDEGGLKFDGLELGENLEGPVDRFVITGFTPDRNGPYRSDEFKQIHISFNFASDEGWFSSDAVKFSVTDAGPPDSQEGEVIDGGAV